MREVALVLIVGSLSFMTAKLFMMQMVKECRHPDHKEHRVCREFMNGR